MYGNVARPRAIIDFMAWFQPESCNERPLYAIRNDGIKYLLFLRRGGNHPTLIFRLYHYEKCVERYLGMDRNSTRSRGLELGTEQDNPTGRKQGKRYNFDLARYERDIIFFMDVQEYKMLWEGERYQHYTY